MCGFYFLVGFILGKCGTFSCFWGGGGIQFSFSLFRADSAGLGKYPMGGYGRIGVYSVNSILYYLEAEGLFPPVRIFFNLFPCAGYLFNALD